MFVNGYKSTFDVSFFTVLINTFLLIVGPTVVFNFFEDFRSLNGFCVLCKGSPKSITMLGIVFGLAMAGVAMATQICDISFFSDGLPELSSNECPIFFLLETSFPMKSVGIDMSALISCGIVNNPSTINNIVRETYHEFHPCSLVLE